jgi:hypothetical protein
LLFIGKRVGQSKRNGQNDCIAVGLFQKQKPIFKGGGVDGGVIDVAG